MSDIVPTDAKVTPDIIRENQTPACRACSNREFASMEPHLSAWVEVELERIAGRLAFSGAPPSITRAVAKEIRFLVSSTYRALRLADSRLWARDFQAWKVPMPEVSPEEDIQEAD